VCNLDDLAFGVAEYQQVGFRIEQHGASNLLRPVVEVRDAPQARLDAADDDGYCVERFTHTLRINDHRAVRPLASLAAGRVRIVAADAAIRGVTVHHRIHVAGGDAEEQVGLAELFEVGGRAPVRLGDEADAEALRLEHAANDCHAETRMIDVGIAAHDDDVAAVPAERVHLLPRHGQEWSRPEAGRPVFAVGKQVAGGKHGEKALGAGP